MKSKLGKEFKGRGEGKYKFKSITMWVHIILFSFNPLNWTLALEKLGKKIKSQKGEGGIESKFREEYTPL